MFELQVPEDAAKAMRDNPQLAAQMLADMKTYAFLVVAVGFGLLVYGVNLIDRGIIPRHYGPQVYFGMSVSLLTALLLVAGYSQAQLAMVTGIYGAIIGFVFKEALNGRSKNPPGP